MKLHLIFPIILDAISYLVNANVTAIFIYVSSFVYALIFYSSGIDKSLMQLFLICILDAIVMKMLLFLIFNSVTIIEKESKHLNTSFISF